MGGYLSSPDFYITLFDYEGTEPGDLSCRKDTRVIVLNKNKSGWWNCQIQNTIQTGVVPYNFLTLDTSYFSELEWWFKVSRREAINLLSKPINQSGAFLVRENIEPGKLALSIKYIDPIQKNLKEVKNVIHYKIQRDRSGKFFIVSYRKFKTLIKLVNHYKTKQENLCCILKKPCERPIQTPSKVNTSRASTTVLSKNEKPLIPKKRNIKPKPPNPPKLELEIKREDIKFIKKLASGHFGEVWQGELRGEIVAVKKLKEESDTDIYTTSLTKEAQFIQKICHHNLIKFKGICSKTKPFLLLMEFASNGSVNSYLREDKGINVRFKGLMDMANQVANGMLHLEMLRFIHRDLRTDNVLLDKNMMVKIADFGLSRPQDIYITNKDSRLPIRWTPIETIQKSEFSIKSDVWSYGVLLYELVTYGERPYDREEIDLDNIFSFVTSGRRLKNPSNVFSKKFKKVYCPSKIYELMLNCWKENPTNRPSFKDIVLFFEQYEDD